jgi:hypothetical protein
MAFGAQEIAQAFAQDAVVLDQEQSHGHALWSRVRCRGPARDPRWP